MNSKLRSAWGGLLVLLVLMIFSPVGTLAQEPTPSDDEVNAVAKELYCPVCENIPLDACGTAACEQWRGVIRDKLSQGWTKAEIKTYFVEQYGDRVLAEPPRRGFNWLVYIVPPLAFLAGVYMLYQGFRTWRTIDGDSTPAANGDSGTAPDVDEEVLSQIEKELQNR